MATMKIAAAKTPAAIYTLWNSTGLFMTTDPNVLSLKLVLVSSTMNSLELTTVSTINSSVNRKIKVI